MSVHVRDTGRWEEHSFAGRGRRELGAGVSCCGRAHDIQGTSGHSQLHGLNLWYTLGWRRRRAALAVAVPDHVPHGPTAAQTNASADRMP